MFDSSWGNSYAKFFILDIKSRFIYGKLHLHGSTVIYKNIISVIIGVAPLIRFLSIFKS